MLYCTTKTQGVDLIKLLPYNFVYSRNVHLFSPENFTTAFLALKPGDFGDSVGIKIHLNGNSNVSTLEMMPSGNFTSFKMTFEYSTALPKAFTFV